MVRHVVWYSFEVRTVGPTSPSEGGISVRDLPPIPRPAGWFVAGLSVGAGAGYE